jgi:hypothetical protein
MPPRSRRKLKRAPAKRKPTPATGRNIKTGTSRGVRKRQPQGPIEVHEIESLRDEIERAARSVRPPRWNADPDEVRRSVVKLVLTLVELIRQLLERQAIRRVDAGTLTAEETEAVGLALMRLEETVREIGKQFDLDPQDLNLDLGPIGKLL